MEGLYQKYHIEKSNGNPCDPNAEYFVLRIDVDRHARKALKVYAEEIQYENPVFANDLFEWLKRWETE